MDKFFSLSVLGMLAVGLNGKVCAQADTGVPENERPNILFILSDDHTSQHGGFMEEY